MKKIVFLSFALTLHLFAFSETHMTRVDPALFIHQPRTDFAAVCTDNPELKRKMVEELFNEDKIDHYGTKAYDPKSVFETYYAKQSNNYYLIDLNADSIPELIFSGFADPADDREYMEVYYSHQGSLKRLYHQVGHLLAFKVHPNTGEILVYHHQYPCCANASHNLNRLRLIDGELQQLRYYFIGKETDLVGPFFPKVSKFDGKFRQSKNGFELRWSPAEVTSKAWTNRSETNSIAKFDSTTVYTVLAKEKGWVFVLVKAAPMSDKKNRVINPDNFSATWIFGWIRKDED